MRIVVPIMLMLACALGPTQAGLFRDAVDLKDLAQLSPEGLEQLSETEFAVFRAQVRLAGAKAAEAAARGSLKTANRTLEVEQLDLKAAQAELKAASANEDSDRRALADAKLAQVNRDVEAAARLVEWKKTEVAMREALVDTAKAGMDVAEAARDLARVQRLKAENVPAAADYKETELEKTLNKRKRAHDKAIAADAKRRAKVESAHSAWKAVAPPEAVNP